ncbi:MAG: hypothetical protein JW737_02300 [Acidobacteria bacterium]|nr:hypothetical protein [Acidobacteriota bacterium]
MATGEMIAKIRSGQSTKDEKIAVLNELENLTVNSCVDVLTSLSNDEDEEVSALLAEKAKNIREDTFANYILMEDVTGEKMESLAHIFKDKKSIVEAIILNPATNDSTIKFIAGFCDGDQVELILLDKPRLSNAKSIYDCLLENPRLTTQLKYEVEREMGGPVSSSSSDQGERQVPRLMLTGKVEEEDIVEKSIKEVNAIQNEDDRKTSVYKQVIKMTVPQKIAFALKGPKEARSILIIDANKVVSSNVLKSPKVNENEVEGYAKMRNVSEDILRTIALNRSWMRKTSIVEALAKNPKTPVAISLKLLPRLNKFVIKSLATSRDIAEPVRKAADRMMKNQG